MEKNKSDKAVISSYTYNVNNLGQRTSVSTEGEAFANASAPWVWIYDALGQLVKENNCQYSYDSIGNRKIVQIEGELEMIYEANNLNQYSNIGNIVQSYDNEGNLLCGLTPTSVLPNRSGLNFVYNAENRPIAIKKEGQVQEEYAYDHFGRRIKKGNSFIIYDGFNVIAEYEMKSKSLKESRAWGLDLSGSIQGAGGVGGLLSVTDHGTQVPLTSYPTYDGNGNVSEYLTEQSSSNRHSSDISGEGNSDTNTENQELGIISAHYEYDAFGNVIKKTGSGEYSYQFSTKPFDPLTGLTYYNYRLYDPVSGRWINRDPIQEKGGLNLYGFVRNNSINRWDFLGQEDDSKKCEKCKDYLKIKEPEFAVIRAAMAKKGCTLNILCKEISGYGHPGGLTLPPVNLKNPVINIEFDCCQIGEYKRIGVFEHELMHAKDHCNKTNKASCEGSVCTEIKAYAVSACKIYTDPDDMKRCIKRNVPDSSMSNCPGVNENEMQQLIEDNYDKCIKDANFDNA